MERAVFDRMAELADEHWWFVARRKILASVIARVVRPPSNARILEIGCGTGHNLAMLSRFGSVDATELDDQARAIASTRSGTTVVKAALPHLSALGTNRYDLVALLDVLEHVRDDLGALVAIRNCLSGDGALLLTVPANPWMWSAHDAAHHHHRRYTKRELASLARKAGFQIELLTPFNSILFPLIAAARVMAKLRKGESSDDTLPARPVNQMLTGVFGLESKIVGRIPMPFGVSLVAVLRPKRG